MTEEIYKWKTEIHISYTVRESNLTVAQADTNTQDSDGKR